MSQSVEKRFDTRAELQAHWLDCIGRSNALLQMFDPDFAVYPLGASQTDAALRQFLGRGGVIELVAHRTTTIERQYPRFLTLLKDYSHRISCRITPRGLHQLTDSFCIGDSVHIVRRFHSDHMRGAVAFDAAAETDIFRERFTSIWQESLPGLHPDITGL